jgi:hypothetical protein
VKVQQIHPGQSEHEVAGDDDALGEQVIDQLEERGVGLPEIHRQSGSAPGALLHERSPTKL